jgi:adaptin ear-binding coat-associated protein 1/2
MSVSDDSNASSIITSATTAPALTKAITTNEYEEESTIEVDQIRVNIKECFVYQIPVLRTSQGHRAEDWKLESPLFTGGLRVYQRNDSLRIIVYRQMPLSMQPTDDSPYNVFAECRVTLSSEEGDILRYVDGVIDSSRYFVLKIKDINSERSVYIGVGFRERDCAFEFKNAINDYIRYLDRKGKAMQSHTLSVSYLLSLYRHFFIYLTVYFVFPV